MVDTEQEGKANALLISKAPELLDILNECVALLAMCTVPEGIKETYGNTIMNATNLIQEATVLPQMNKP